MSRLTFGAMRRTACNRRCSVTSSSQTSRVACGPRRLCQWLRRKVRASSSVACTRASLKFSWPNCARRWGLSTRALATLYGCSRTSARGCPRAWPSAISLAPSPHSTRLQCCTTFAWPARDFASTRLEVHLPPHPGEHLHRRTGERAAPIRSGKSTPSRAVAGGVTRTNGAISARHVGSDARDRDRARARTGGTSETRATPSASAGASGTAGGGPSDGPSETSEETGETGEIGEIGEIGTGEGPSETSGAGGRQAVEGGACSSGGAAAVYSRAARIRIRSILSCIGEKDKIYLYPLFWRAPRANRANVALGEATRRPIESSSANECSPTKSAAAASAAARGAHATGTYRVSRRPKEPLAQEPCVLVCVCLSVCLSAP